MSLFCPNPNDKNYQDLQDIFGKDLTYYIWNKNNGNPLHLTRNGEESILYQELLDYTGDEELALWYKGSIYSNTFLAQYGDWTKDPKEGTVDENGEPKLENIVNIFAKENRKTHPDPVIAEDIQKYGSEINDWNNTYVWNIEKEFDLIDRWETIDGKKTKLYKPMSFNSANTKAHKIRLEHGVLAKVSQIYSSDETKAGKYIVLVGKRIGLPSSEDNKNFYKYNYQLAKGNDKAFLTDMFSRVYQPDPFTEEKPVSMNEVLSDIVDNFTDVFEKRPDLLKTLEIYAENAEKIKDVTFDTKETEDFASHMITEKTGVGNISLNKPLMLERGNKELYLQAVLHEIGHAFTVRALVDPEGRNDREFGRKIKTLYNETRKTMKGSRVSFGVPYGLKNEREFISEFLTNPYFTEFLKMSTVETNLVKRIINAIVEFLFGMSPVFKGEQAYAQVEKAFNSFIKTQDSIKFSKESLQKYKFEKDYMSLKNDLTANGNNKTRSEIEKILRKGASKMKFDEASHTYTHIETGEQFTPVTELMGEFGYGVDKSMPISDALKRGANLGTAIHKTIEGQITGVVEEITAETGFEVSASAKKDLAKVLEQFRGEDVTVLSEILVADVENKVAGTVDLIIIDNKGRLHIFDFKNKEKGFRYYTSTKYGHSDKKKYHLQLSIYKHIIEKSLGLYVADMNVIMLKPEIEDAIITGVSLDKSYNENGIDKFTQLDEAFSRVYFDENQVTFKEKNSVENKARDDREKNQKLHENEEFLSHARVQSQLSKADALLEKTKTSLKDRLDLMKARYSFQKRRGFEIFYNNLDQEETTKDAFLSIVNYSAKMTNQLWARYEKMQKNNEEFTPDILFQWRDYLLAYEQLDELLNLTLEDTSLFSDKNTIDLLTETVKRKNFLRDLFKTEGKELIAKWLTPYYNRFRVEVKEQAASDYRRESRRLKKEGKNVTEIQEKLGTLDEYIQNVYLEKSKDIDEKTYNFLYDELTVASRDVNDITRWLDNMLDTSDAVSAAMVNAFVEADEKARVEAIEKRTEVIEKIRELQKEVKKGKLEGEQDYYRWMLEHDEDGNLTQFILKPWNNKVFEIERELRKEYSMTYTDSEAKAKLKRKLDKMRVLNEAEFTKAVNAYINRAYNQGHINKEDYDTILLERKKGTRIESLAKDGKISEESSEFLLAWVNDNRPYYYNYAKEYQSKEWNKFMDELGISTNQPIYQQQRQLEKSDHPKAKFYNYITQLSTEANTMLPYSFRIGYRLPGVAKTDSERMKEGQDPVTFFKETSKQDLFVRPEDTERGNQEFTDEQGNVKYFLPIHYTVKLEPQNQSYDIPGIFYKFWESSNSHSIKRNILSEMEMAKYFVETRRAKKRNPSGKLIERLGLTKKTDEDTKREAATINTTSVAAMLGDWFEMAVYGRKAKDASKLSVGQNLELDVTKAVDALNRYTSLNLLGFNVVQGTANVLIGETMQAIDAIAGEHVTAGDLTKATLKYSTWLPGMMGDVGLMAPEHVGSLIIERFNVLHESPTDISMSKITRTGQLASMNSLFFIQKSGEHWMQARFLFARLINKRAYDKDGNDIGSMLDQYYVKDGNLTIKDEVDLVKSKWTEAEQTKFMRKTKGLLSRMHGEYSDLGRVAIQRMAVGRMAYMFRKFVIPGMKRRWQSRQYIERLDQTVEGNYRTTIRFAGQMLKDLRGFKLSLMSEDWAALSEHEKANIHRTISETAFLTLTIIMAGVFYNLKGDADDEGEERFWAFMSYQAYRLKTEMLFFSPKLDEAMSILRSPMASMSIIENIIKITGQMWDPLEEYERGPWKGELKIKRTAINFIPVQKQFYKLRDIDEQIQWFRD